MKITRAQGILATIVLAAVVALLPDVIKNHARALTEPITVAPLLGMPGRLRMATAGLDVAQGAKSGAPITSSEGLAARVAQMEKQLLDRPTDAGAAVLLADALLRQARVADNGGPAARAAVVLTSVLKETPAHYDAKRLLGAVYLSQHRFRDALEIAARARDQRPADAWNYGIIGDAYVELGDYEKAFDAFDRMVSMRPSAAAYARVAYARELQGNLEGALRAMQMAEEATTAHDPEAQAWYTAQVGNIYFAMGKLAEAERAFRRSALLFPSHPAAVAGHAKVRASSFP